MNHTQAVQKFLSEPRTHRTEKKLIALANELDERLKPATDERARRLKESGLLDGSPTWAASLVIQMRCNCPIERVVNRIGELLDQTQKFPPAQNIDMYLDAE